MSEQLGLFDAGMVRHTLAETGGRCRVEGTHARTMCAMFDGTAAREEAITRVEASASRAWLDAAWDAILYLRGSWSPYDITSDEVWDVLAGFGVPPPHDPRAMGPVMRRAVREGLLRPTSTFRPSAMPQNHRRPVRVYEVAR